MLLSDKSYPAKILLFGEYVIINGGKSLSIPFDKYSGRWQFDSGQISAYTLEGFFSFLKTSKNYDKERLDIAIAKGLSFESTIPQGYGLGSSGALTAAAYDQFYKHKAEGLRQIKRNLADAENFFHGESSGLDPLTIYTGKPLFASPDHIDIIDKVNLNGQFALIDSKQRRNTKYLVDQYKKLLNDRQFYYDMINLELHNRRAIKALLANESLDRAMSNISEIQYESFKFAIPSNIKKIWRQGLDSHEYYMKLLGAGGGGYFLVYGDYDLIDEEVIRIE